MQRKKKPVLNIKTEFFKVQKIHFSKEVNPCFWSKYGNYLVHLNFVKIRLEIMLSDFAEKKTSLTLNIRIFQTPKYRTFSKGLIHTFGQKCHFFLYLDLIKIRLEIMLSDFDEKKEIFSGFKQHNL